MIDFLAEFAKIRPISAKLPKYRPNLQKTDLILGSSDKKVRYLTRYAFIWPTWEHCMTEIHPSTHASTERMIISLTITLITVSISLYNFIFESKTFPNNSKDDSSQLST